MIQIQNRHTWFFERNGQYRGNSSTFVVPYTGNSISKTTIKSLNWNRNSTILMLHLMDFNDNTSQSILHLIYWKSSIYPMFTFPCYSFLLPESYLESRQALVVIDGEERGEQKNLPFPYFNSWTATCRQELDSHNMIGPMD